MAQGRRGIMADMDYDREISPQGERGRERETGRERGREAGRSYAGTLR